MAKPSDRLVFPVEIKFSMEIEDESIPHKNLVKQISQASNLCKMDELFVIANNLLTLLPLFANEV